jgi:PIN domain nuclease of toxin-antitoxin system
LSAVLLDTQVLIWWLLSDHRISRVAFDRISNSNDLLVSAASIYEIDFKRRDPHRLRAGDDLLRGMPKDLPASLSRLGMKLVSITPLTAWLAANLPFDHGDPWDRILVAHALDLEVPLISADRTLKREAEAHVGTRDLLIF